MKFGCHGSTWELDYDVESDRLPEILDTIQKAGFRGIDAQISLLGRFKENPQGLQQELERRGLELAALTFPFSWETESIQEEVLEQAAYYIKFLKNFDDAKLNFAPRVHQERDNLRKNQLAIIELANKIAKMGHENGVLCSFHPSSPPGSFFRIKEDYELLFEKLDFRYASYTPDAGHIAFGGMDVLEIFKKFLPHIKHVHFKDASKSFKWEKMGTGDIDFPAIIQFLKNNSYDGWIMIEEETNESAANPDDAVMDIGEYVKENLLPIAEGASI